MRVQVHGGSLWGEIPPPLLPVDSVLQSIAPLLTRNPTLVEQVLSCCCSIHRQVLLPHDSQKQQQKQDGEKAPSESHATQASAAAAPTTASERHAESTTIAAAHSSNNERSGWEGGNSNTNGSNDTSSIVPRQFYPSSIFVGPKAGYLFGRGSKGIGYYYCSSNTDGSSGSNGEGGGRSWQCADKSFQDVLLKQSQEAQQQQREWRHLSEVEDGLGSHLEKPSFPFVVTADRLLYILTQLVSLFPHMLPLLLKPLLLSSSIATASNGAKMESCVFLKQHCQQQVVQHYQPEHKLYMDTSPPWPFRSSFPELLRCTGSDFLNLLASMGSSNAELRLVLLRHVVALLHAARGPTSAVTPGESSGNAAADAIEALKGGEELDVGTVSVLTGLLQRLLDGNDPPSNRSGRLAADAAGEIANSAVEGQQVARVIPSLSTKEQRGLRELLAGLLLQLNLQAEDSSFVASCIIRCLLHLTSNPNATLSEELVDTEGEEDDEEDDDLELVIDGGSDSGDDLGDRDSIEEEVENDDEEADSETGLPLVTREDGRKGTDDEENEGVSSSRGTFLAAGQLPHEIDLESDNRTLPLAADDRLLVAGEERGEIDYLDGAEDDELDGVDIVDGLHALGEAASQEPLLGHPYLQEFDVASSGRESRQPRSAPRSVGLGQGSGGFGAC
ncbi:uba ts-n domain-containing protein [Cyclospora cayetanensis]|uniref:Uba ts-n domain-containing protein n=1 Tax=Cyclospora cayetanensis TaxID=88456 RepID=A0A1D3CQY5_9EIME|nr:uba ts-n domain-containing protein [Cyclospora cayetanensis]